MPSFIAHVVYAQKFIKQNQISDPDNLFVIGNLIPDIRYLGTIDRSTTHIPLEDEEEAWTLVNNLVTISGDVPREAENLFKKGFLFHNFLDEWWTSKFPIATQDRYLGSALKLYEDQLLYSKIENMDQILKQLKIQPNFFGLNGVSKAVYQKWIQMNITYLPTKPTISTQMEHFNIYGILDTDQRVLLEESLSKIPPGMKKKMEEAFESFAKVKSPNVLLLK